MVGIGIVLNIWILVIYCCKLEKKNIWINFMYWLFLIGFLEVKWIL